jgi:hypothetical protein
MSLPMCLTMLLPEVQRTVDGHADAARKAADNQERGDTAP